MPTPQQAVTDETKLRKRKLTVPAAPNGEPDPGDKPEKIERAPKMEPKKTLPRPPNPPFLKFSSEYRNEKQKPEAFLDYYNGLLDKPEFSSRLAMYVYRYWPVIDREKLGKNKAIGIETQPLRESEDVLRVYGSGDYYFILNDVAERRKLCTCKWRLRDDNYPPVLESLEELVITEPANRSYIDWLQMKGVRIPGIDPPDPKEEKEEMSAEIAETTRVLAQTVERMAVQSNNRPAPEISSEHRAERAGLEIVGKAAEMGSKMIETSFQRASEISSKSQDPMEMVKSVLEVSKQITHGEENRSQSSNAFMQFMIQRAESSDKMMMSIMQSFMSRTSEQQASAPGSPKGLIEQLRELREARDLLKGLGEEEESRPIKEGFFEKHGTALMGIAAFGLASIGAMVHNAAVARSGQGQPATPPPPPAGVAPQIPPQYPEKAMAGSNFFDDIRSPLLRHLSDDSLGGSAFAEWIILGHGQVVYEQIRGYGADQLFTAIQSYPPIWNEVQAAPQLLRKFIEDFVRGPEAVPEEAQA